MEILLVGVIIFFVLIYNKKISTKSFLGDNKRLFDTLKEKDYEFLLRAKYGDRIVDVDSLFNKRIRNGMLTIVVVLFVFISNLSFINIIIAIVLGFVVFKSDYSNLKSFYKKHLNEIDSLLPYYLKSLEVLIQHYTVPVALARSIDDAPEVFKPGLREMIAKIEAGDSSIDPYVEFANRYPVKDSMRMMRLLYRLGLGEQEKKHKQLLSFSKSVSNLQEKSREEKYKARLWKMENMTMTMLFCTGGFGLFLMLVAMIIMLVNSAGSAI